MNNWQLLEYAAWALSIVLGLYILIDTIRTNRAYSEDLLTSSREGDIDDAHAIDPAHPGGQK